MITERSAIRTMESRSQKVVDTPFNSALMQELFKEETRRKGVEEELAAERLNVKDLVRSESRLKEEIRSLRVRVEDAKSEGVAAVVSKEFAQFATVVSKEFTQFTTAIKTISSANGNLSAEIEQNRGDCAKLLEQITAMTAVLGAIKQAQEKDESSEKDDSLEKVLSKIDGVMRILAEPKVESTREIVFDIRRDGAGKAIQLVAKT